ncbi:hypothetical protein [Flavobacterium solisilvae]|uniref:Uncharacterized protein n=1 Tax=Flavobacterium solisilvae TaxID=1852019 RepID=A0ABX1QQV6_9FLAO|nr:hypothetical protein [Flavobacterium solisilvae]NMH24662.1 hypothetical protein [Flavobacterium solisilvae]
MILLPFQLLCQSILFNKNLYICIMGRNNAKNIKAHNDKLHKAQSKEKAKKIVRAEQLKAILKRYNSEQ